MEALKLTQSEDLGSLIASHLGEITLEQVRKDAEINAIANASFIKKTKSIHHLRDTELANNKSAIIIAAGPSLHRFETARMIKNSKFSGLIIATESAMSWCLRNDIIPQLTVTLDPHHKRIVRWFGDPELSEGDLAADDYFTRQDFDPAFRTNALEFNRELTEIVNRFGPQIKIAIASCASKAVVARAQQSGMECFWWNPIYDDYDQPGSLTRRLKATNDLPCLNAGGNVGSACWVFAHAVLGIKNIAILGMDLGYYPETKYSETQKYYELRDLVGEENLHKVFTRIFNPYVKSEFYTEPTFLWYRDAFLQMAGWASEEGVTTYNCTGGGILFGEGIKFVSFEQFLADTAL